MHCSELTGYANTSFLVIDACFLLLANAAPSSLALPMSSVFGFSAATFRRAGRACPFFRGAFVARFATSHKWFLAFSRCNARSWRRLRAAQQGSVRREMSLKIFARLRRRREKRNENPKRSGRSGPHDQKSAAIHIICTFWMPKSLSRFQNRLHRLQPDSSRQDQRRLQRMWSQRTSPELSAA